MCACVHARTCTCVYGSMKATTANGPRPMLLAHHLPYLCSTFYVMESSSVCLSLCRKKNSVDRVIELTGLDHKCLREAQGRTLLEDERQKVREEGKELKSACRCSPSHSPHTGNSHHRLPGASHEPSLGGAHQVTRPGAQRGEDYHAGEETVPPTLVISAGTVPAWSAMFVYNPM